MWKKYLNFFTLFTADQPARSRFGKGRDAMALRNALSQTIAIGVNTRLAKIEFYSKLREIYYKFYRWNQHKPMIQKSFFKILLTFNKMFLPSVSKLNVYKMSKFDKMLVGYKYWVVLHVLD